MAVFKETKLGRERRKHEQDVLDNSLDKIDEVEGVTEDRIVDSLAIDGETHPQRLKIHQEIERLHVRKPKRRPAKPTPDC